MSAKSEEAVADISILSLETELLFGVTQPCTRPIAGRRSISLVLAGEQVREEVDTKPTGVVDQGSGKTLDRSSAGFS